MADPYSAFADPFNSDPYAGFDEAKPDVWFGTNARGGEFSNVPHAPNAFEIPGAGESLLGPSFAQAVQGANGRGIGNVSSTSLSPIISGPPSAMVPPRMHPIDYLRLTQPTVFNRPATSAPLSVGIPIPKEPMTFGLSGRGPDTTAVVQAPVLSAEYGVEPLALSTQGDAFLRRVEGNSVTASPDDMRRYGIDPQTHLYGSPKTFGIGHRINQDDADLVAQLKAGSMLPPPQQEQKAEDLYADDKQQWYNWVRRAVGPQYFDSLAQNQRDALVTTAFNGGGRSISKNIGYIQHNQLDLVPNEFNAWNRNKKMDPGLVRRQLQERALWNGNYNYEPTNEEIDAILEKGGY